MSCICSLHLSVLVVLHGVQHHVGETAVIINWNMTTPVNIQPLYLVMRTWCHSQKNTICFPGKFSFLYLSCINCSQFSVNKTYDGPFIIKIIIYDPEDDFSSNLSVLIYLSIDSIWLLIKRIYLITSFLPDCRNWDARSVYPNPPSPIIWEVFGWGGGLQVSKLTRLQSTLPWREIHLNICCFVICNL